MALQFIFNEQQSKKKKKSKNILRRVCTHFAIFKWQSTHALKTTNFCHLILYIQKRVKSKILFIFVFILCILVTLNRTEVEVNLV